MSSEFSNKLVSATSYTFIGMIIVNTISIINSIIVARLFNDPTILGKLFIIQNLQAVVSGLILFSIPIALVTFIAKYKKNKKELEKILSNGSTLLVLFSIGTLVYFLSSSIIAVELYQDPNLNLLIKINSLNVMFLTFSTLGGAILRGFQKIKKLAVWEIINSLVLMFFMYFFISQMGLLGAIIAYTISSSVSLIIVALMVIEILNSEEIHVGLYLGKKETYDTIRFSLPIFISGYILISAKWFVATYLSIASGFSEVGFFKIGTNLQSLFLNIPSSIGVPLLPMIGELNATNPEKIPAVVARLLKIVILITLPFIIVASMSIKYLIIFFYGTTYEGAWVFSYLVLISLLFVSMSPITMNIFLGIGKPWIILYLDILSVLSYIIFSYFLIGEYGIIGIGLANIISNIISAIVKLVYLKFKMGVEIELLGKPFLLSFTSIVISYYLLITQEGFALIGTGFILLISVLIIEYFMLTLEEKKICKNLLSTIFYKLKI